MNQARPTYMEDVKVHGNKKIFTIKISVILGGAKPPAIDI